MSRDLRAGWPRTVLGGTTYFSLVFAAGFVLGAIRTQWVVPAIGARAAELLETPVMIAVSVFAARWTVHRLAVPAATATRLAMGGVALILMLGAEFGLVLRLRGMTVGEYLATRDPVSGTAYYCALLVFAALPLWLARAQNRVGARP